MTPHPATTVLAKALFLLAIAAAAGCDRDGAQMPIGQKTHELKLTGMQEPCPAGLSENGRPVSQAVLDRVRQVKVTGNGVTAFSTTTPSCSTTRPRTVRRRH